MRPASALVDTGAEPNIVTKAAADQLGLKYRPCRAYLKTINAPPTPVSGLAQAVDIALGDWHGKTDFYVAPVDLFDIILGQDFFLRNPVLIAPYHHQLIALGQGGTSVVPLIPMPRIEATIRMSDIKLVNAPLVEEPAPWFTPVKSKN